MVQKACVDREEGSFIVFGWLLLLLHMYKRRSESGGDSHRCGTDVKQAHGELAINTDLIRALILHIDLT